MYRDRKMKAVSLLVISIHSFKLYVLKACVDLSCWKPGKSFIFADILGEISPVSFSPKMWKKTCLDILYRMLRSPKTGWLRLWWVDSSTISQVIQDKPLPFGVRIGLL